MIDLPYVLRDGAFLSVAASAVIVVTLWFNPRLFLRHYPKEIIAATPPKTKGERIFGAVAGVPLLVLLIGIPIWSASMMAQRHSVTRLDVFLDVFVVSMMFNLVDWLVLDIVMFGLIQPRWITIPGTEHVPFRYNHFHHFRGFIAGTVLAAVVAVIGLVTVTRPHP